MLSPNNILAIAGLGLILLELVIGIEAGFDLVLIGSILLGGGLLGSYTGNFEMALVVSAVLSIVYILFGRNLVKEKIIGLTRKTNVDKLMGQKGVVIRSITPNTAGLVRIDDEDWRASSDEVLYEKDRIEVTGLEGVTLSVRKSK
jgi:inner membrane protein